MFIKLYRFIIIMHYADGYWLVANKILEHANDTIFIMNDFFN